MGFPRAHLLSIAAGLALLGGCAVLPKPSAAASQDASPLASAPVEAPKPAPSESALSPQADAQFHVLMGQTAAGRGQNSLAAHEFLAALAGDPDAKLAARATAFALAAKDDDLALTAARAWLQLEPTSMDAREGILALALHAGHDDEAYAQAEAILRDHPGGLDEGFHYLALLLSQDPSVATQALALMSRLVAEHPKSVGAYSAQSLLDLHLDKLELAENSAREALQLDPKSRDATLLLTTVLVRKGAITESDGLIENLCKSQKDPNEIRIGYARLLLEANQQVAGRRQYAIVLKTDPKNSDAHLALGLMAIDQVKFDEAEAEFRLLATDPKHASDAAYFLGRIAEARNQFEVALQEYAKVNAGNQALDAEIRSAVLLGRLKRIDDSKQAFAQMREQYPPLEGKLINAEGEMLIDAGLNQDAVTFYSEALDHDSDDTNLLYSRSLAYEKLNQIDKAETDLHHVLAADPNDARALNALGYMLSVHTERLDEAKSLISKAYALTPDDPAVIDSMGWVDYRQGDSLDALPLLQKAYQLFPDPEVAAHLGEVLWSLNQKDAAHSIWNAAAKQDPDNQFLRDTVKRLSP